MSADNYVSRTFIYIGDRLNGGKLASGFILLPPEGATVEEACRLPLRWWTLKGKSRSTVNRLRVGAVVSMETDVTEDHCSIRLGTLRTEAIRWDDPESVLRWTAEHCADHAEAERLRRMKDRDALHEALDPVREMYASLRGRHRTAILAEIVRYITNAPYK